MRRRTWDACPRYSFVEEVAASTRREVAGEEGPNQRCPALMGESQSTYTPCALGTRVPAGMLGSAAGLGEGNFPDVAPKAVGGRDCYQREKLSQHMDRAAAEEAQPQRVIEQVE